MKLSDLKALVAHIESGVLTTNPDPDIQFWVVRHGIEHAGPKESPHFVQFTIDHGALFAPVSTHRTCVSQDNTGVIGKNGDFHIPLLVAPFYA